MTSRIITTATLTFVLWAGTMAPAHAQGESWMYRRSYFSHQAQPGDEERFPVPESRTAYRTPIYPDSYGVHIRSGFRINNYIMQNGNRIDRSIQTEGWFDIRP